MDSRAHRLLEHLGQGAREDHSHLSSIMGSKNAPNPIPQGLVFFCGDDANQSDPSAPVYRVGVRLTHPSTAPYISGKRTTDDVVQQPHASTSA